MAAGQTGACPSLESALFKRLVTGAKKTAVSRAGDWSTALGLQRSLRKTKFNTEKMEGALPHTESGSQDASFLY